MNDLPRVIELIYSTLEPNVWSMRLSQLYPLSFKPTLACSQHLPLLLTQITDDCLMPQETDYRRSVMQEGGPGLGEIAGGGCRSWGRRRGTRTKRKPLFQRHPSQPLNGGPVRHLQKPRAPALLVAMATPGPNNGLSVSLCPIESADKAIGWDCRRERNVPSPCQPFCLSRPLKQIGE